MQSGQQDAITSRSNPVNKMQSGQQSGLKTAIG